MFDFSDKVVLITGPAGNLGNAVARKFQMANAKLVLLDRLPDRLSKIFPELSNSPNHFLVPSIDLMDPQAVQSAITKVVESVRRIDVLVNTVGGYRAGQPVHETTIDTWDMMMNLNGRTAFILSQTVIPYLLAQGSGKIINVGARPGLIGRENMAAYSASKSAVIRLTESMSAELKSQGINVNCILPGTIDTPQNREAMPKADFSRWVPSESLANVILFLASDTARDIHGAAIPVYGLS